MKRLVIVLGFAVIGPLQAEVLTIPTAPARTDQRPANVDRDQLPQRGATMAQVTERFGEPQRIVGPVGDPPITRWFYPGFSVFFEYRHVISAVIPGKPAPIHHQDELRRAEP